MRCAYVGFGTFVFRHWTRSVVVINQNLPLALGLSS